MVGLGETAAEVGEVLADAAGAGVDAVTIGQYLQPHAGCLPVARYVTPEEFDGYAAAAPPLGSPWSRRRSCARPTGPASCWSASA